MAICVTVFTACGDDDDEVPTESLLPTTSTSLLTTTTAQVTPIVIRDFSFANLDVKAGTKVLVQNTGTQTHTLTAVERAFDTGVIEPGRNVELTVPSRTGTFRVVCTIHPDRMTGELKVS